MPSYGGVWVGAHDSPRAGRRADGKVEQLTYKFSGKLRKRFYEDASLESLNIRKTRLQRQKARTEAKLKSVLLSMTAEEERIAELEESLDREQRADIGTASIIFGAVVLQSAWRTHKAHLKIKDLREVKALGILSVNLKSYVLKKRKHNAAQKIQRGLARQYLAFLVVRRLMSQRDAAVGLQAQWRGIKTRAHIRHMRLVRIVAEGYVEQICLFAQARLYQRRILPQIAAGVIQRKYQRYAKRKAALEAKAKNKPRTATTAARPRQGHKRVLQCHFN